MTDTLTILTPNLGNMGLEIQDNVLKGYRLVEGYPLQLGWQYEAIMKLIEQPIVPVAVDTPKQMCRPKKQA